MVVAAKIEKVIEIPDGVRATISDSRITIKGKLGRLERFFPHPKIKISNGAMIIIAS